MSSPARAVRPKDDGLIDIDAKPYIVHEFHAVVTVDGGLPKVKPTDPAGWIATLRKLAGPIKITVQRPRKRRSQEASNYTWGVVYVDVLVGLRQFYLDHPDVPKEERIENDDDLHEAMKYLHFGLDVVTLPGGTKIEREHRTRYLDSKQYAAFVDFVRSWAAERGMYTRDPGEEVTA